MGALDFHVSINIKHDVGMILFNEYTDNSLYRDVFSLDIKDEEDTCSINIVAKIDNFMFANTLIYTLVNKILSKTNSEAYISTKGLKRHFAFESKTDFFCFMYSVWEDRIDSMYRQFGTIVLPNKSYYKDRNKLYKRYYKKIL